MVSPTDTSSPRLVLSFDVGTTQSAVAVAYLPLGAFKTFFHLLAYLVTVIARASPFGVWR
jgi:hypothetical protein